VFDDAPGNICVDYYYGDGVAEAFAKAAHVTRLRLVSNRIVVCAMEPRSAIGEYDAKSDRYILRAGNRSAFGLKHQMADLLKIKPDQMRADRQCRRLVWHEGLALSRICRAVPCLQDPGPSGQMDRRALRQLLERPAWPRPRFRRRAGARQGRQVFSRALTGFANVGGYLANVGPLMGSMGVTRNLAAIYRTPLIEVATTPSPTPRRSAPIAAPAAPRPTTSWSG
jgi:carbon-monoxide dehydrogenase large subunit